MRLKEDGLQLIEYKENVDVTKIDLHFQTELEHCVKSNKSYFYKICN